MIFRTLVPLSSLFAMGAAVVSTDSVSIWPNDLVEQCAAAADVGVPDVTIDSATPFAAGTAWDKGLESRRAPAPTTRPFCRIQGKIDRTIGFELWLPTRNNWNGKFLGGGVGGAAGTFNYTDLPRAVSRGYAAGTTDTGHKVNDQTWMLDRRASENYTHLANHLLAVKSKEIINAVYGEKPQYSYFIGCSGGGRQGLKELQLYPADYDGIITGANGPQTPEMTVRRMWEILQRDAHPGLMEREDWQLIAAGGTAACDAADGVEDGLVEDPRECSFRISSLTCKPGQTKDCLSTEQVAFAETFYRPLRDSTGRAIDEGIMPGVLVDSGRSQLAPATFGQAVRGLESWNGSDFDVRRDLAAVDRVLPQLRADSPDVSAFRDRGGKLIQYTGWYDGAVDARMVIAYQEALTAEMGGAETLAEFARLYMLPGVHHCRGGPGPDQIGGSGGDAPVPDARHDLLTALEEWVEWGRAPEAMIASKIVAGEVTRTRLICPYPKRAEYTGGDPNFASSFRCTAATEAIQ